LENVGLVVEREDLHGYSLPFSSFLPRSRNVLRTALAGASLRLPRPRQLHGGADDFLRHGERQVGRVPEAVAALAAVEPSSSFPAEADGGGHPCHIQTFRQD